MSEEFLVEGRKPANEVSVRRQSDEDGSQSSDRSGIAPAVATSGEPGHFRAPTAAMSMHFRAASGGSEMSSHSLTPSSSGMSSCADPLSAVGAEAVRTQIMVTNSDGPVTNAWPELEAPESNRSGAASSMDDEDLSVSSSLVNSSRFYFNSLDQVISAIETEQHTLDQVSERVAVLRDKLHSVLTERSADVPRSSDGPEEGRENRDDAALRTQVDFWIARVQELKHQYRQLSAAEKVAAGRTEPTPKRLGVHLHLSVSDVKRASPRTGADSLHSPTLQVLERRSPKKVTTGSESPVPRKYMEVMQKIKIGSAEKA